MKHICMWFLPLANPTNEINGFPHVSVFFSPRENRAPRPCEGRGFQRNSQCRETQQLFSACIQRIPNRPAKPPAKPCRVWTLCPFLKKKHVNKIEKYIWEYWNCYGILLKVFCWPWLKNLESMCYKGFTIGVLKAQKYPLLSNGPTSWPEATHMKTCCVHWFLLKSEGPKNVPWQHCSALK